MNLSIIIPTYNRVHVLGRAIESVLQQSYFADAVEWELIVVDDGSTDSTEASLANNYPQIIYLKQDNGGVSAARNLGLEHASGEWLAFLDSDDEWLVHKLSAQFALLAQSTLKVCHTEEIWIRDGVRVNQMNKHKKAGGRIFERCLPLCAMSPSSIIIHQGVFDSVGVFDEQLPACEDYDLWLKISSQYEVAYVEQACINKYGGHEDQLSRQYWGMDRFRVIALENLLIEGPELTPSEFEAARSMLLKKLGILLKGARKHNNRELVERCQTSLLRFSELVQKSG